MDIQKNARFRYFLLYACLMLAGLTWANDDDSLRTFKESYLVSDPNDYPAVCEKLKEAYETCDSSLLKQRIQHRIGVLHLVSGDAKQAYEQFSCLAAASEGSPELRIASTMMAAQAARMQGFDNIALECYDKVIDSFNRIAQEKLSTALTRVYISSIHGKAEIYAYQKRYPEACQEYGRAIDLFKKGMIRDSEKYLPYLYDQLAQFHLKTGSVSDYLQITGIVLKDYSSYKRAPLVSLEAFAVQLLTGKNVVQDYTNGGLDAPAQLILYAKEHKDSPDIGRIEAVLQELSVQSENGYAVWLVKYHYAWFLDTVGKRDQAGQLFDSIISGIETGGLPKEDCILSTILAYSRLQKAILEGESGSYKEGLQCLDMIDAKNRVAHIGKMIESVRSSLETLKREVPKDADKNL